MESIKPRYEKQPNIEKLSFLQKLEKFIPSNVIYLMAGVCLLVSIENTSAKEKSIQSEKTKPFDQKERVMSEKEKEIFDKKFDYSVLPRVEKFIIRERKEKEWKDSDPIVDSLFSYVNSMRSYETGGKTIEFYPIDNSVEITLLEKMLEKYKTSHPELNYKVDSVESKRTLDKEDYKTIFPIFFKEGELELMLDCVSAVCIDMNQKGEEIPERYGIQGEVAGIFFPGTRRLEIKKYYLDNCTNVKGEAETMFHELGHAFDPVAAYREEKNSPVYSLLKDKFVQSIFWDDVMEKDQDTQKDSMDTFFSYPMKISNSKIRESEDFAESFSNYFWHPLWLQERAPTRFKVIDALMKTYLGNPKFNIFERNERAMQYLEKRNSEEELKINKKIDEIVRNFQ